LRVEVINTGTELLLGKVINSHLSFFGEELFKLGLRIEQQICIPDGDAIRTALIDSFKAADIVLVTGGLGPTSDDITREITADLLGRELYLDASILDGIREMFESRGYTMSATNDRQAMVPDGAEVLDNPNGTAPGLYLPASADGDIPSPHIFLLPGPPRELKPMFVDQVAPRIRALLGPDAEARQLRNFKLFGIGESTVAERVEGALAAIGGLELGYCARLGEVDVRCIASDSHALEQAEAIIREAFPRQLVNVGEQSIEEVLIAKLRELGQTIATAESCTGGLIASTLTDASGSSSVFHRGYVTYANDAKQEILGVPAELLEQHGAVSEEVVRAMAEGCLKVSGADHAISVSGIAGPTGGSKEKPVGTVHLAVASRADGSPTHSIKHFYPVERSAFKLRTTRFALDLLRQRLAGLV
jgi:nicotinamide-nucleotide amidase